VAAFEGAGWARTRPYRLCANYDRENVCKLGGVPGGSADPVSLLSLKPMLSPDLTVTGQLRSAWYRLEVAKAPARLHLAWASACRLAVRTNVHRPDRHGG